MQPTPAMQLAPVPQTFPAQQAWSAAPQGAHWLSVPQISEALPQVLPAQQGWPAPPQAAHLLSPPQISEALPQLFPPQQG